jgi:hypothetical protein
VLARVTREPLVHPMHLNIGVTTSTPPLVQILMQQHSILRCHNDDVCP